MHYSSVRHACGGEGSKTPWSRKQQSIEVVCFSQRFANAWINAHWKSEENGSGKVHQFTSPVLLRKIADFWKLHKCIQKWTKFIFFATHKSHIQTNIFQTLSRSINSWMHRSQTIPIKNNRQNTETSSVRPNDITNSVCCALFECIVCMVVEWRRRAAETQGPI